MQPESCVTLHRFRWPFAAARASAYVAVIAALALTDPAGSYNKPIKTRSAMHFALLNSDIVVKPIEGGWAFVDSDALPPSDLPAHLAWLRAHNPRSRVIVRALSGVRVERLRPILQAIQDAGYERYIIETQPFRPLLLRRLAAGRSVWLDRSVLQKPPSKDDFSMRWELN